MRQWFILFLVSVATGSAQPSQKFFIPAGGTTPLGLIQFTGIQVQSGDTLQFSATGLANGCPGHFGCIFRDANGAPAGSQEFSGPESGGNFQIVTDGVANIYSLVGAISNANNDAHFQDSQWFAIGTSRKIVADRTGELVLALENAVYNGATGISDGEGGFTVTVTVGCAPSLGPVTPAEAFHAQDPRTGKIVSGYVFGIELITPQQCSLAGSQIKETVFYDAANSDCIGVSPTRKVLTRPVLQGAPPIPWFFGDQVGIGQGLTKSCTAIFYQFLDWISADGKPPVRIAPSVVHKDIVTFGGPNGPVVESWWNNAHATTYYVP